MNKTQKELSSQTLVKTFKVIRYQRKSFCELLTRFVIVNHDWNFKSQKFWNQQTFF